MLVAKSWTDTDILCPFSVSDRKPRGRLYLTRCSSISSCGGCYGGGGGRKELGSPPTICSPVVYRFHLFQIALQGLLDMAQVAMEEQPSLFRSVNDFTQEMQSCVDKVTHIVREHLETVQPAQQRVYNCPAQPREFASNSWPAGKTLHCS